MLCQRLLRTVIGTGTAIAATAFAGLGVAVAAQPPAASPARACNPSVATPVSQPSSAQMAAAGLHELPVAALERRVDLVAPAFSNSTNVTNRLFSDQSPRIRRPERHGRRQAVSDRDDASPRHEDHRVEPGPVRQDARLAVLRLPRRAHPGGRSGLLCAGRRRLGLVLRRGRLQLPARCRGRHLGHVAGGQGGARGDDHARRSRGRRRAPAREHPRAGLGGGRRQGRRPAGRRPARSRHGRDDRQGAARCAFSSGRRAHAAR